MTCDTLTSLAKVMDIAADVVTILGLPSILHSFYDTYQVKEHQIHSAPSALWWGLKYWLKHRNLSLKYCYNLGLEVDRQKNLTKE